MKAHTNNNTIVVYWWCQRIKRKTNQHGAESCSGRAQLVVVVTVVGIAVLSPTRPVTWMVKRLMWMFTKLGLDHVQYTNHAVHPL